MSASQALDALRSELPRQEWAAYDVYGHWPLQFDHKESIEFIIYIDYYCTIKYYKHIDWHIVR